MQKKNSPKGT